MIITHTMMNFFLVFSRIGAFLMIAPGYSSDRLPPRSRLYFSLGIAFLISPSITDIAYQENGSILFTRILSGLLHEIIIGVMLGLLFRIFLVAMESFITTFSLTIGISNIFSSGFFDNELSPSLSSLIILTSIQLIFASDLHHIFIQIIDYSFHFIPVNSNLNFGFLIKTIVKILSQTYLLALSLTSPFLLFAIIVNVAFAFLARLSPQTPIYFVTGPFVILLGIYVFNSCLPDMLSSFISSFHQIIDRG